MQIHIEDGWKYVRIDDLFLAWNPKAKDLRELIKKILQEVDMK